LTCIITSVFILSGSVAITASQIQKIHRMYRCTVFLLLNADCQVTYEPPCTSQKLSWGKTQGILNVNSGDTIMSTE